MNDLKTNRDAAHGGPPLEVLIQRFREAESSLQAGLQGQVDAILDPVSAIPILLRDAQSYLQSSEARYRRLLSRSSLIVFELEVDGTTTFVNQAAYDILGYTEEELLGRNWWSLLLPDDQAQVEPLNAQFQTGDVTQYELTVTTRQGATAILELSTANRRKPDGTLDRILGLAVDITERRQAELELIENHEALERLAIERMADLTQANVTLRNLADLRQRLLEIERAALAESEHANRMKLQFLSTVSHELRTPLTSIKGFAMTLMADDVSWDTETQQSFIAIINEEADKLADLVDQLLDLSQLQAGKFRIRPVQAQLPEILSVAMAQLEAISAQHQLILNVPSELPPIMADTQRIAAVLVNLVGNAAKFSPPGTPISVSVIQQDTGIQVDVRDDGPGIAVENREHVFDTFWQPDRLDNPTKGAGLGLAICKGIVTAHGGTIWVADVSSGTTISFTLPSASSATRASISDAAGS